MTVALARLIEEDQLIAAGRVIDEMTGAPPGDDAALADGVAPELIARAATKRDRLVAFLEKLEQTDAWPTCREKDDLTMWYKQETESVHSVRVRSEVPVSMLALLATMAEVDLWQNWVPSWRFPFRLGLQLARVVHMPSRASQIVYVELSVPYPWARRSALLHCFLADCRDETVCGQSGLVVVIESITEARAIELGAAAADVAGGVENGINGETVRAEIHGGMVMRHGPMGRTAFQMLSSVDPKLALVPQVVISFMTMVVEHIFRKFIAVASRLVGSEYERRMRDDRDRYAYLESKL